MLNSFWVYIIPGIIGVFNMIVIRSFIEALPEGLMESAKIDGAGDFITFSRIVLPLTVPALATVSLFVAVYQWNSWFDVFLYNSSTPSLSTLQYEPDEDAVNIQHCDVQFLGSRCLCERAGQQSDRYTDLYPCYDDHCGQCANYHRVSVPAEVFRQRDGCRRG